MVIEISWRWPFVRKHVCHARLRAVHTPPHRTWVKTDQGVGWLDHHEADGYVVQLKDGRHIKRRTDQFTHVEGP